MYNIKNLEENLINAVKILSNRYSFNLSENGREIIAVKTEEDKLIIKSDASKIEVFYKTIPSFLRAIGLIVQKEREGVVDFNLETKVWFDFNGLMIDCSRNGVINVSYAKDIIEQLAFMGQNVLMLYMEDTYEICGEEYFGYLRGAYKKEELKEIDDYANQFGIELIPCIQTLAHLEQFFMWEEISEKYLDIDNILNVSSTKVKELLEKMIKHLSETFRTKRIHIGMDEAYNLGRGAYADKNGLKNKTEIMREHLENMLEICDKYNIKPIIWDDMFFSNYSKTNSENYKIPDGIDLMYWDYYNNNITHYEKNLENRSKITNKKIMFAGGSWRWIGYASHHSKTFAATNASLTACKNKNVREVMTTAWADDGCESPVSTCLFGCVLFAEHQYNEILDFEEFRSRLKFITKMDYENFMKPEEFDIFPSFKGKIATVTPSKYTFYEDPLCSKFIKHTEFVKDDLTKVYSELSKYFADKTIETEDKVLKATNNFYSIFGEVLSLKWNLGLNIYNAYRNKDKNKLKDIIKNQVEPLIPLVEKLKYARMEEWYLTNKSYGFEVLDLRFGGIISRLYTTKMILQNYIDGKLKTIEELEEKRLAVVHHREDEMGEILHYNRAQRAMTANKMIW